MTLVNIESILWCSFTKIFSAKNSVLMEYQYGPFQNKFPKISQDRSTLKNFSLMLMDFPGSKIVENMPGLNITSLTQWPKVLDLYGPTDTDFEICLSNIGGKLLKLLKEISLLLLTN